MPQRSPDEILEVRLRTGGSCGPVESLVAVGNVFDRSYVSSVAINASFGCSYEPAPRRTLYAGISLSAGR